MPTARLGKNSGWNAFVHRFLLSSSAHIEGITKVVFAPVFLFLDWSAVLEAVKPVILSTGSLIFLIASNVKNMNKVNLRLCHA